MSEIHNETRVIQKTLGQKKDLIIFDIGGCNFHDSLYLKQYFPNSEIYSFEPSRDNLNSYKEQADRSGVLVVPVAVSNKNDATVFYNSPTHIGSGSTLKPKVKEGTHEGINHDGLLYDMDGYEVQIVRLDTFCELNNIDHIDYLHIDVQGAEKFVIEGLGNIRPYFIFAETCEFETYESGITTEDFDLYMDSLGYEIIKRFRDDTLYKLKSAFPDFEMDYWLPKI
jgi:FkbM family methyltransferase